MPSHWLSKNSLRSRGEVASGGNHLPGLSKSKWVSYSLKALSRSNHEFQHQIVRRPPTLTRISAETVPATTGVPEKRIKGWPFFHIPSSRPRVLSSLTPPSIFTLHLG